MRHRGSRTTAVDVGPRRPQIRVCGRAERALLTSGSTIPELEPNGPSRAGCRGGATTPGVCRPGSESDVRGRPRASSTTCCTAGMAREVTRRELRNDSGEIMRQLDQDETFVVTRNGEPVGELTPAAPPSLRCRRGCGRAVPDRSQPPSACGPSMQTRREPMDASMPPSSPKGEKLAGPGARPAHRGHRRRRVAAARHATAPTSKHWKAPRRHRRSTQPALDTRPRPHRTSPERPGDPHGTAHRRGLDPGRSLAVGGHRAGVDEVVADDVTETRASRQRVVAPSSARRTSWRWSTAPSSWSPDRAPRWPCWRPRCSAASWCRCAGSPSRT